MTTSTTTVTAEMLSPETEVEVTTSQEASAVIPATTLEQTASPEAELSAAVQIAGIEATVAVAEIEAEARVEIAQIQADESEDLVWLRETIQRQMLEISDLKTIVERLTPLPLSEEAPTETTEETEAIILDPNLTIEPSTLIDTSEPTELTQTELTAESEHVETVAEVIAETPAGPVVAVRRLRWM